MEGKFAAAAAHTGAWALQQLEDAGLRQLNIEDNIDTPTSQNLAAEDRNERNISSCDNLEIVIRTKAQASAESEAWLYQISSAAAQTQLLRVSDTILPSVENHDEH